MKGRFTPNVCVSSFQVVFIRAVVVTPAQGTFIALGMLTRVDSSQLLIRTASVAAAAADWSVVLDNSSSSISAQCRCRAVQMWRTADV